MSLLKSLIITNGVLTLWWAFLAWDVSPETTRFPALLYNMRFDHTDTDGAIGQLLDTQYVEALAWNLNTGMAVVTLIAGYAEDRPMAYISGAWMLIFAGVQTCVAISFQTLVCTESSTRCALPGIWSGFQVVTAAVIIFYAFMGVVTLWFARRECKKPNGPPLLAKKDSSPINSGTMLKFGNDVVPF